MCSSHQLICVSALLLGMWTFSGAIAQESQAPEQTEIQDDEARELENIVVTGTRQQGYIIEHNDALGIPLKTIQTPASVTILSDDLLEDLGARTLGSVLPYVAGVSGADNGGVNRQLFNIRGFPQTQTFVNGVRQSITAEGIRAIDTIERVQILKGPAGVEASLTSPGGFINIITKKPEDSFRGELFGSVGDFGFARVGGDVTGPLPGDRVNGRLIAAYEHKQWWRDGQDDRPVLTVAPSLEWKLTEVTDVLLEYEYSWQDDPLDRGTIYVEGAGFEDDFLPRTFTFHGNNDQLETENHRLDLSLNHRFNDHVAARLYYQRATQEINELAFRNAESEAADGVLFENDGLTWSGNPEIGVFFADYGGDLTSETLQAELTADFDAGAVRNTVNFGASTASNEDIFTDEDRDFIYGSYFNVLNIFAPDNNQEPIREGEYAWPNFVRGDEIDGLFAQWLAEWTARFRSVASFRYDDVEFFSREDISGIGPEALAMLEAVYAPDPIQLFADGYSDGISSYRLAASFDLLPQLTAFAGYSESGEPQSGFTRAGDSIDPVLAKSIETGVKWSIAGGNALVTGTLYHLEREDIAISDPANEPNEAFLVPLGAARIRGLEVEVIGKLTEDISAFGGFSVQDSEILESDSPIVGNRFANTPDFQASAFLNYNARALGLPGLDLALGSVHQGDREANSANEYQLPAYTRVDLALGYTLTNDLQLRVNVENLFDETYYTAAQDSIFGSDQIAVGDRRLFQVTATKRF